MLEIAFVTSIGAAAQNDDRIFANGTVYADAEGAYCATDACVVAVCDGVGGEACGWKAAEIVAGQLKNTQAPFGSEAAIREFCQTADHALLEARRQEERFSSMATTIACLAINGDDFWAFNIGDSRIYKKRHTYVSQISIDHSVAAENDKWGLATPSWQAHTITRSFGGQDARPDIFDGRGRVAQGDLFLLCSDGLWGSVDDIAIETVLNETDSLQSACRLLLQTAIDNGSEDNISIIIVRRMSS